MERSGSDGNQHIQPSPVLFLSSCYFFFLFEPLSGTTFGKHVLGLQIYEKLGQDASLKKLLIRFSLKTSGAWIMLLSLITRCCQLAVLSLILSGLTILGFFLTVLPSHRALHDLLSGTAVFTKSAASS